jgi:hypothetical protein
LAVVTLDSLLPELFSEHAVLRQKILDGVLLSAVDPAGEDHEQQLPWMQLGLYVPPDAK